VTAVTKPKKKHVHRPKYARMTVLAMDEETASVTVAYDHECECGVRARSGTAKAQRLFGRRRFKP
jgi:hypothetical protein